MLDEANIELNKFKLKNRIYDLTRVKIDLPEHRNHYFKVEFDMIQSLLKHQKQYYDRLIYFDFLLHQIKKIEGKNPKDFKDYLKKLSEDGQNPKGELFEILTYAKLIDRGIQFSKPKNNPDFVFPNFGNVALECTSRNSSKDGFYYDSIAQTILKKEETGLKQNYANDRTALHIDITKSVYNSYYSDDFLDEKMINCVLDDLISEVSFGSICLIYYSYLDDGKGYGQPFIRYKKSASRNLVNLHKKMFSLKTIKGVQTLKPFL